MVNEKLVNSLVELFIEKQYYLMMGAGKLARKFNTSKEDIYTARYRAKYIISNSNKPSIAKRSADKNLTVYNYTDNTTKSTDIIRNFEKSTVESNVTPRVLVIGDTHLPYEKEGYLEFCKQQYDVWGCNQVVHIGDLIDSHATSHHPSDPNTWSPGNELEQSILKLKSWYKVFPHMKVAIGNHDLRAYKLSSEIGVASKWIRGYAEVLEVPNWDFQDSFLINGITYIHGTGTSGSTAAYKRMLNLGGSVVMGHLHSEASIMYHKMPNETIFGMVVGCGVDINSAGMAYARNFPKKSIISCAVVLDKQPILITMP